MQSYIHIGKIVAAHGISGEMVLVHSLGNKADLKNTNAVFIEERKNSYIPHFIISSRKAKDDELLIKIEEIDTKEKAQRFIKKNVWLTEDDFEKIADKNAPIALLGYTIFDNGNMLGIAEEIIAQPHDTLLVKTTIDSAEVLLPVHTETLKNIDRKTKEIHLQLPEGLLEIYLKN